VTAVHFVFVFSAHSIDPIARPSVTRADKSTRKLSYRKLAKMTARCALYFREYLSTPTVPRLLLSKFLMGFCSIDPMNVRTQVELHNFTPFLNNTGYSKNLGSPWLPGHAHAPFSSKFLMGFCSGGPCECNCQIWNSYLYQFLLNLSAEWNHTFDFWGLNRVIATCLRTYYRSNLKIFL